MKIGIILGGGIGTRMNNPVPKQYLKVCRRELIDYSISAFRESELMDDFIVVSDSEEHRAYLESRYGVKTILGGKTRNESFSNALDYIAEHYDCESIFVNEAARPLITAKLIDTFLTLSDSYSCIYCVKDVTDSLETADGAYVRRSDYKLVMSPEAYSFETIRKYFDPDSETTFPGHTIPDGYPKYRFTEYTENVKITYPEDLDKIESMISRRSRKRSFNQLRSQV